MAILDVIQECHVFKRLSSEQCQKLASISHEETYKAGQYIFREGDQARYFYIIEDGKVELEMNLPRHGARPVSKATIGVIAKGTSFGWSMLIGPHVFSGSARAVGECKVIALDGTQLLGLMDADHTFGYQLLKRFSEEVAHSLEATRQTLLSERGLALLDEEHRY